jgi:hypothetical protein
MKDVHGCKGCDRTGPHQCPKKVGHHLEVGKGEGIMSTMDQDGMYRTSVLQ